MRTQLYMHIFLTILNIAIGKLPVKYLGLPPLIQYPKARHLAPLIDKVRGKIEGWQSQCLSYVGRLELIKTVLYSSLTYWVHSYDFSLSTSKELERICANFPLEI